MTVEVITLCLMALIGVLALAFFFGLISVPQGPCAYTKTDSFMIPAEQEFLSILDQAVGDKYRIFAKVHMADLLRPERQLGVTSMTALENISTKRFDYVLCDKNTLAAVVAIELDGKIHRRPKVKQRDAFINDACIGAGLTLMRFNIKAKYDSGWVRNKISLELQDPATDLIEDDSGSELKRSLA